MLGLFEDGVEEIVINNKRRVLGQVVGRSRSLCLDDNDGKTSLAGWLAGWLRLT